MDNEQTKGKKAFASIIGKEINGLADRLNLAIAAFATMDSLGDMDETLNQARTILADAFIGMVVACEAINSFVMSCDKENDGDSN